MHCNLVIEDRQKLELVCLGSGGQQDLSVGIVNTITLNLKNFCKKTWGRFNAINIFYTGTNIFM